MNVVEMRGICKYFSHAAANKDIDFCLEEGEIHALLGENGAGKSTLMSILYGLYSCDAGTISIGGQPVSITSPSAAIQHGIGMVHQHFMLIPQLTVTQNVFLGMREAGFWLKMGELEKKVAEYSARFGFNVDPKSLVWQIPVGIQQKVEIIKVLARKAKILILDEPTAVLTPGEVDELFQSLKALSAAGYSIVLITHKMREVLEFADRVTVMRDGVVTGTLRVADTTEDELAHKMVGRSVSLARKARSDLAGKTVLQVRGLCVNNDKALPAVKGISFEVRAGEIVGIAGVDGNGQLELGESLIGGRRVTGGEILVNGQDMAGKSIRAHLENGFGHIPDDRQKKGLVWQFPLKDNFLLSRQRDKAYTNAIFLNTKAIEKRAAQLIQEFDVRPPDMDTPAGRLSGGNQQKVILAREVSRKPQVMLAYQPTRGLDIGAIEFVRAKLMEQREKGASILLISTDLDEILTLSDRILIIQGGEIMGEVGPDTPVTEIGLLMTGHKRERPAAGGEAL